ncbi:MAG: hypothetical protein M3548_14290, partial [Actinomycetota bacterium]|nr:hypothetical protein [Actinomycetota bacterium]
APRPAGQPADVQRELERVRAELTDRVRQVLVRAEEIDDALEAVLARVAEDRLGDGGATSLTAAADAGAAMGVEKPPIPGAPPAPPVDAGAGKHGMDPWYTRVDDYVTKALATDAAAAADSIGWTHAAKNLEHYLNNSGDDARVDPNAMMRDAPGFHGQVDKTTAGELRRIADEAAANGTYGKPVQFSTGWKGYYIGPEESKDWYYAMGGVQYSVTGVAVVHPPEQPGGQPRVEMDYQTHVFDRYNWDGGKQTQIGPITITDEKMAEMHRAGVAQEYNISGSTETRHYGSELPPPGQQPSLPPPPDDRTGTRTDPGR